MSQEVLHNISTIVAGSSSENPSAALPDRGRWICMPLLYLWRVRVWVWFTTLLRAANPLVGSFFVCKKEEYLRMWQARNLRGDAVSDRSIHLTALFFLLKRRVLANVITDVEHTERQAQSWMVPFRVSSVSGRSIRVSFIIYEKWADKYGSLSALLAIGRSIRSAREWDQRCRHTAVELWTVSISVGGRGDTPLLTSIIRFTASPFINLISTLGDWRFITRQLRRREPIYQ